MTITRWNNPFRRLSKVRRELHDIASTFLNRGRRNDVVRRSVERLFRRSSIAKHR